VTSAFGILITSSCGGLGDATWSGIREKLKDPVAIVLRGIALGYRSRRFLLFTP
jgi:hypothetical protein